MDLDIIILMEVGINIKQSCILESHLILELALKPCRIVILPT